METSRVPCLSPTLVCFSYSPLRQGHTGLGSTVHSPCGSTGLLSSVGPGTGVSKECGRIVYNGVSEGRAQGTDKSVVGVTLAEVTETGQGHSLTQGATGERLCWKPGAQRLQVRPVTPSLQGHWPVVWLQVLPAAPTGWQSQAEDRNEGLT